MIALAWRFRLPIAIVCAAIALMVALSRYVADAVADDRTESRVEALEADSKADDVAGQVAASEAATIEQESDDARKAAAGSDDPLKSGLDRLRDRKAGGR